MTQVIKYNDKEYKLPFAVGLSDDPTTLETIANRFSFHLRKPPGQQCPGRRCTSTHPPALDPAPGSIGVQGIPPPALPLCTPIPPL
jgi:hypothetical protein